MIKRYCGYSANLIIEKMFGTREDIDAECKERWLFDYIDSIKNNVDEIKDIFDVICNLDVNLRKKLIHHLCNINDSFDMFSKVRLFPTHRSWSGSEVPLIEKDINFLECISSELKGIEYIEHRAYITEKIRAYQKYKEKKLLEEFLEIY